MASGVDALTLLARKFLDVSEYATSLTAAGTPALSFIAPSRPTWDCCPMLAVHVQALAEETTSPLTPAAASGHRSAYGRINLARLVVTIVRCAAPLHEDGTVVTTEIEAVAAQVQEDGWSVWNALNWAIKNEEFGDLCSDIHVDLGAPVEEQGGCVGWTFTIRAEIGGMPNPGPHS